MKFAGFATSRARKSSSGSEPDDAVSAAASGRSAAWMNETPRVLFECFSREVFELQSSSRSMASGATARGAFVAALSELFSDSITLSNAPKTRPVRRRVRWRRARARRRAVRAPSSAFAERISLRDAPPYAPPPRAETPAAAADGDRRRVPSKRAARVFRARRGRQPRRIGGGDNSPRGLTPPRGARALRPSPPTTGPARSRTGRTARPSPCGSPARARLNG